MTRISPWIFAATLLCLPSSFAQSVGTALVRNAPQLNGTVDGNLQEMTGKSVTLNGSAIVTGDLLVVGTPGLQINGTPNFGGVIVGTGSAAPSNYKVTLNGSVSLGRLRTRTDALALPVLPPVPSPTGTRNVTISAAGQSIGDFATLRNLTLNGNVGQYEVPPGTFGDFIANGGSGFTLGVAGSSQPAVYNLQHLTLNGQTNLLVVGPVVINVANGFTANGASGTSTNSSWLKINLPSGGLTLNGGSTVYGYVTAPNGTVIINDNAKLVGGAICNALTVNGNGLLQLFDITDFENHAPIASDQAVTTDEDVAKALVLAATDPDGQALTYTVVSSPAHGALDGTPPNLTYTPVPGFSGTDTFTFRANDGQSESNVATVFITVAHVNHPPTAEAQTLVLDQNGSAAFALAGGDVDGDSLTFRVTSMPAHGALSGVAPNLTYTPVQDFYGSDSLGFVVNDGAIDSSSAVVSISVNHVNHSPIAIEQNVALDEDTSAAILLTGTDADGDTLSFAIVAQPQHGALSGSAPNLVYTSVPDYFGSDSFTFRVNDGVADSESATVNISVASVNDPPGVSILTPTGGSQFDAGDTIHITATASDKDGSIAILRLLLDGGVISEQQQGTATFDSFDAAAGDHTITAIAVDNQGASTTSTPVLISVRGQDNGPVQVNAGPDLLISLPATAHLDGAVTVNGVPAGQDVQLAWQEASGPGNATFDSSAALKPIVSFDVPGDYVLKLAATAPEGTGFDSVKVTVLAASFAGPNSPISNQGREFWMAFLSQQPPNYEPDHAGAFLVISSEVAASGTVEIWSALRINGAWQTSRRTETFTVEAGEKTLVEAVGSFTSYDDQYDQALPTAVHVQADAPVAVHALNYNDYSTDGSLILPNGVLGREYFVMSYRNSGDPTDVIGGTQVAVVATKDPTEVIITPTASTSAHPAGQAFSITLHTGEVYRMINNDNREADFTGTRVQSDQPVAVFGGHTCAQVPAEISYCDHLYEQMPPVDFWGRHFITLPLKTRSGGDRYKLLAAKDGTRISVNGQILATLNAGQFYETVLDQAASILGDQPILLAQFAQSSNFDHTTGDPFLTLIPPYEEFGRHYILGTQALHSYYTGSDIDIFDSYLGLIVASAQTGSVTLNGQPVAPSEFTAIGDSGFSGATLSVPKDTTLNVSAAVPIGAWLYGWASYESFGFTGGLYGAIDTATAQFELTQSASSAPLESVHHVIASFVSGAGLPVPDAEVAFSVTGANPISGTEMTAPDGTVEFSWTGQQPGDDIVTATTGALSSSLSVTWVAGGDNQPPQVNAGPDVLLNLGQLLALHGTVQDDGLPVGGSLTFKWSALPGPGDVTFTDSTSVDASATFLYPGQYHLRLSAYDGQFAAEDDLLVTVNSPPAFLFLDPSAETIGAGKYWSVGVSAEDQDGLIAKIELIDGNEVLDVLQPNSQTVLYLNTVLSTTFSALGTHSLVVRLIDDRGATADRGIDVTVRPVPTVQILTPADNTSVAAGESVAFTASASSSNGTITRVVYSDVTDNYPFEIGDGAGSNYQFIWTPTYTGTRLIAATAYDSTGASGDSAAITINLQSPGDPTISITSPSEGGSVYLGQTVAIQAEASAVAPAEIGGVYFYDDDTFLGYDYSIPFELSWTPMTLGVHSLTGGVYDSFGGEASTAISVNVVSVPPLDVSFVQPLDNSYLQVNQPTTLVAGIGDLIGTLDGVQFYVNDSSIGDDVSESVTWMPPSVGDYQLQVHASSSGPNQEGDQIITVHVADLHPPVVQWNTPADGASFPTGSVIALQAQASDIDGNLASFQLQADGELLSETAVSGGGGAASFAWDAAGPGWHSLGAVAIDDTNQFGSAFIRVFVERPIRNDLLPPSSLTAEPLSSTGIHLTWIPSTSTDSISTAIERRAGVNGVWQEIASVGATATTYDDNALEPEHYYSYRVAALDSVGARSIYSGESSATTKIQLPSYAVIDITESLAQDGITARFFDFKHLIAANGSAGVLDPIELAGTRALSVNDNGEVLVDSGNGNYTVWKLQGVPDVLTKGQEPIFANTINASGVAAGSRDHSYQDANGQVHLEFHTLTWTDGDPYDITPQSSIGDYHEPRTAPARGLSDYEVFEAYGIGDAGDVVGRSTVTYQEQDYVAQHAALWSGNQWINLGGFEWVSDNRGRMLPSYATAINASKQVVGVGGIDLHPDGYPEGTGPQHAFLSNGLNWNDAGRIFQDLGTLGGYESAAWDLNTAGVVIGVSTRRQTDPVWRVSGFVREGGASMKELQTLGGTSLDYPDGYGYPLAINDLNQIVGQSLRPDGSTAATLWQKNDNIGAPPGTEQPYEPFDLNDSLGSNEDWFLVSARDVGNNGLIVGQGVRYTRDGQGEVIGQQERAYLLIPVDIKIESPFDHAAIPLCDNVILRAQTTGAGSPNVTTVEYYAGGTKIAEALDPNGWPATWPKPSPGDYTIAARAVLGKASAFVESPSRPVTILSVTRKAIQIVYDFEVGGGQAYYENFIKSRPEWPGDKSGVTIGIGYDLKYNSVNQIRDDWTPYLPPEQVDRLVLLSGRVGNFALRNSVLDITIPWSAAEDVFYKRTVTRYSNDALAIYPNANVLLSPNDFGALVSIIFNRGNGLTDTGRSTKFAADPSLELRQIRDAVENADYNSIPRLIANMKRLWPDLPSLSTRKRAEHLSLRQRRDREAAFFQQYLNQNECD